MDAYEVLSTRVNELIQFSKKRAVAYNVIYRSLRVCIIVLSALTAGAAKYGSANSGVPRTATPYLAIAVAILASLDSWLKPGKIYWEHYRFNDLYIAAQSRLALIHPSENRKLAEFANYMDTLDKQYGAAVRD